MAYRDRPAADEQVLDTFDVAMERGGQTMALLFSGAMVFGVAFAVAVLTDVPPAIAPWVWTFPVGAVVFGAPAVVMWSRRRRKLQIVRLGADVKLRVPGQLELTFPLRVSGTQMTTRIGAGPVHHVYLKLADRHGRAIVLQEIRGAAYGAVDDWLSKTEREPPAESYELSGAGDAVRIRAKVEALNAELAD
ncbi:MAG: hypothetical protein R3B36_29180 [Polyangiaceae bacterium]